MPLLINNKVWTKKVSSASEFLRENRQFKPLSEELCAQKREDVGRERRLLYVNQRECAIVRPNDEHVKILGTDAATTCHMVVVRHTGSGVTSLAHCDGCDTERGLHKLVSGVRRLSLGAPEGRLEVSLVGGFIDPREESTRLSQEILGVLMSCEEEVHLVMACITDNNDELRGSTHFPIIYGIGVEIETGRIFPASFPDRGPIISVRSACHFAGVKDMFNIYDIASGEIVIGPYTWTPWREAGQWMLLPDPVIRQHLSTSPEQEPEGFEQSVREALRVLYQHPHPEKSLFPEGQPQRFRADGNGGWSAVTNGPSTR